MTRTREERPITGVPVPQEMERSFSLHRFFFSYNFFPLQDLLRFYKFSLVIIIANKIGTNFSIFSTSHERLSQNGAVEAL